MPSRPKPLKRLSPTLKRRFDIAWQLMPSLVQHALKPFIIRVEERESLEGAEVQIGGRVVATSEADCPGRAMIAEVDGQWFGAMLLKSDTAVIPEGPAVAIICHELAHALQHMDYGEREWLANESETELSAWFHALAWLTFHAQRYERHYEGINAAIAYALEQVDELVGTWARERAVPRIQRGRKRGSVPSRGRRT